MSDRHLRPSSALVGVASPGRFGKASGEPGVVIQERSGLGLATVAARKGQAAALKQAVAGGYGVELPDSSRVAHGSTVSFIGYGPGQWLAVSETLGNDTLARDLAQRLKGLASISDQSGGRTVLRISGPRARDVLAKGLPIDLDPRAFPSGQRGHQHDLADGRAALANRRYAELRRRHLPQRVAELLALAYRLGSRVRLRGHTIVSSPPPVAPGVKAV